MKKEILFQKFAVAVFSAAVIVAAVTSGFSQTAPKQEVLLNGLKILMWNDAGADKVTVKIRIHSGSAFDPQGREGVMQLLADNIFPNSASREFFAEDLGGSLEIVTNYDYIQINASSKPEHFLTMLETLSAAVSNPAIDKETTAKLRAALSAKVKALESDPAYVTDQAVAKRLFGTFPYGRPQLGTPETVQKIEFADLLDARKRFLTADNATITVSGNFDRSLALKAFRRDFGGWLKSDRRVPSTFRQPDEPDTKVLKIEVPNIQGSVIRSAQNAPAQSDKDYYAMAVFGRLLLEKNCQDSVTFESYQLRGVFLSSEAVNSKGEVVNKGLCLHAVEKSDFLSFPDITPEEFERAKASFLSYFQNRVSSYDGLADLWLDVDTYRLNSPQDELQKATAVTLADIRLLEEKLFKSPRVRILIYGSTGTN